MNKSIARAITQIVLLLASSANFLPAQLGGRRHLSEDHPGLRHPLPRRPSRRRTPLSERPLDPEKKRRLQQLYAGRAIGLLPDFGGAAPFWLLEAGLDLQNSPGPSSSTPTS